MDESVHADTTSRAAAAILADLDACGAELLALYEKHKAARQTRMPDSVEMRDAQLRVSETRHGRYAYVMYRDKGNGKELFLTLAWQGLHEDTKNTIGILAARQSELQAEWSTVRQTQAGRKRKDLARIHAESSKRQRLELAASAPRASLAAMPLELLHMFVDRVPLEEQFNLPCTARKFHEVLDERMKSRRKARMLLQRASRLQQDGRLDDFKSIINDLKSEDVHVDGADRFQVVERLVVSLRFLPVDQQLDAASSLVDVIREIRREDFKARHIAIVARAVGSIGDLFDAGGQGWATYARRKEYASAILRDLIDIAEGLGSPSLNDSDKDEARAVAGLALAQQVGPFGSTTENALSITRIAGIFAGIKDNTAKAQGIRILVEKFDSVSLEMSEESDLDQDRTASLEAFHAIVNLADSNDGDDSLKAECLIKAIPCVAELGAMHEENPSIIDLSGVAEGLAKLIAVSGALRDAGARADVGIALFEQFQTLHGSARYAELMAKLTDMFTALESDDLKSRCVAAMLARVDEIVAAVEHAAMFVDPEQSAIYQQVPPAVFGAVVKTVSSLGNDMLKAKWISEMSESVVALAVRMVEENELEDDHDGGNAALAEAVGSLIGLAEELRDHAARAMAALALIPKLDLPDDGADGATRFIRLAHLFAGLTDDDGKLRGILGLGEKIADMALIEEGEEPSAEERSAYVRMRNSVAGIAASIEDESRKAAALRALPRQGW